MRHIESYSVNGVGIDGGIISSCELTQKVRVHDARMEFIPASCNQFFPCWAMKRML